MKINFLGSTPYISPQNFDDCINKNKKENKPKENSVIRKIVTDSKARPVSTQISALNFFDNLAILSRSSVVTYSGRSFSSKPFELVLQDKDRKELIETALKNTEDIFEVTLATDTGDDQSREITYRVNSKGNPVKIIKDRDANRIIEMQQYSSEIDKSDIAIRELVKRDLECYSDDELAYFIIANVE